MTTNPARLAEIAVHLLVCRQILPMARVASGLPTIGFMICRMIWQSGLAVRNLVDDLLVVVPDSSSGMWKRSTASLVVNSMKTTSGF